MALDMARIYQVDFLKNEWWRLCERLEVRDYELIRKVFGELIAHYSERHRHYHGISHFIHCLEELMEVRDLCKNPDAVEMALWWHDAVYDVARKDNESCSALDCTLRLMEMGLSGNPKFIAKVHAMILFTTHKELPIWDAKFVVDIDLSSLGAPWEAFQKNTDDIAREYCEGLKITRAEFNAGRAKFIETMLPPNRPYIYSTDFFREKYEARAQANLERSLKELQAVQT